MTIRVHENQVFKATDELVVQRCCNCSILFAMPKEFNERAERDHSIWFYCPKGHRQHYIGETKEERLKRLIANRDADVTRLHARVDQERARADHQEHRANGYKGNLRAVKNRVANGVCPCCKRTFRDLARHMGSKHPDYGKGHAEIGLQTVTDPA